MCFEPLGLEFYAPPADQVARALLGMRLVRMLSGQRVSAIVSETEAYRGEQDQACHARAGRTARTAVMYGPPGRAYIFFTYGMHWMLNVVCELEGYPAAVLLRAIQVEEGSDQVARRRAGIPPRAWTDGPAKLCRALDISGSLNGLDLTRPNGQLWIEPAPSIPETIVLRGPRVGIDYAAEPWLSIPWRFRIKD